jgi:hypothetical protein
LGILRQVSQSRLQASAELIGFPEADGENNGPASAFLRRLLEDVHHTFPGDSDDHGVWGERDVLKRRVTRVSEDILILRIDARHIASEAERPEILYDGKTPA